MDWLTLLRNWLSWLILMRLALACTSSQWPQDAVSIHQYFTVVPGMVVAENESVCSCNFGDVIDLGGFGSVDLVDRSNFLQRRDASDWMCHLIILIGLLDYFKSRH